MLAVPFFVGAIAGVALVVPVWMKKSKAIKKHKKKIHELEEKLLHISEEVKTEEPETEPVEREISQDSTKDQF
jgi:alcohol dehydrogenase YqhD (iron-dependent ADH family)